MTNDDSTYTPLGDSPLPVTFTPLTGPGGVEPVTMDVRLQQLLAWRQHGIAKPSTASTGEDEVAVIAKVTELATFEAMSEVTPGVVLGDRDSRDGTTIVTARLPVERIDYVRKQPFVISLKAAQRLAPQLSATTTEINARADDLPSGRYTGGNGVIIGVVDVGGDFVHRNFLTAGGTTRLLKIWDQNAPGAGTERFGYGNVHDRPTIDVALQSSDPYRTLGYSPGPAAHGTHVMDIAAGNGNGTGRPGVAPEADLIFVDVSNNDVPLDGEQVVGSSFGDSVQLLEALAFVFTEAGDVPCSVNVSLSTNGGPHDGTTLVEQGIDRLLSQAPNRAVCIAAANAYTAGIHAAATVPASGAYELAWLVAPGDRTQNELEIWYPGSAALRLELVAPDGQIATTLDPGRSGTTSSGGQTVLFAASRLDDPNNGDNTIGIFLAPSLAAGRWLLRLTSTTGVEVPFHAWIERDDGGQSTFEEPLDNTQTIGSISCGHNTIVVGSYDAHKPAVPVSYFSSAGPTRDGRRKPEVSAPGQDVVAASARSITGTTRKSGTSMACPAVAGSIALLLSVARRDKRSLSIDEIRTAVISTARSGPPHGGDWHDRYGNGRISVPGIIGHLDSVS